MSRGRKSWFERLFRLLPRKLRELHGDEIADVLEQRLAEESAEVGWMSAFSFRLHIVADFAGVVVRGWATAVGRAILPHPQHGWRPGASAEKLTQDLRYGVRSLARNPSYTAVVVLTIALGIGATASIFSVVDAVIFQPLALPQAHRVVQVREQHPSGVRRSSVANYLDFTRAGDVFEKVTPLASWNFLIGDVRDAESLQKVIAQEVSSDFLSLVGAQPILGRDFLPDERFNWVTGPTSTMLTYDFWQNHFQGSADVVGQTFKLTQPGFFDVIELTVVGVLPPNLRAPPLEMGGGIRPHENGDLLLPPRLAGEWAWQQGDWSEDMSSRSSRAYRVLGRLRPDVSVEQAQARLTAIAAGIAETYPDTNAGLQVVATPLPELIRRNYGMTLLVAWAAAALVLAIACVNVASLLLGRGMTRRWEFAVRSALGAGRGRLFRQLFMETLLLASLGGVTGLILASLGTRALVSLVPAEIYRLDEAGLDPRVFAFVLCASLATAVLSGILPAIKGAHSNGVGALKQGTGGVWGRLRSLDGLVVAELAVALVLVTGAGLLFRTYQSLTSVELGFDPENLMTVWVEAAPGPITKYGGRRARAAGYREVRDRLTGVPGVVAVGGGIPPLSPNSPGLSRITLADRPLPSPERRLVVEFPYVPSDYFEVLRVPVLAGRTFTDEDDAHRLDWTDPPDGCESAWCAVEHAAMRMHWANSVVVNDVMAQRFWPGESALGKVVYLGHHENPQRAFDEDYSLTAQGEGPPVRHVVVGVVPEIKRLGLAQGPQPQMYRVWSDIRVPFMVRTRTDPRGMVDAVRTAVESMGSELTVTRVEIWADRFQATLAEERFRMFLIGLFAAMAVFLAAVGLFGLMAYAVKRRTREIGIRVSLGARSGDILRLVGRRSLALLMLGGVIGLVGALGITRFMSSLLFGVTPLDPVSFAGATLLLAVTGVVACYMPTRWATRVDPAEVMRTE